MEKLLQIFNKCLTSGDVPQPWKNATIIPLLKNGKPASALASYRPISLTSCVVKLLERMFSERLYFLAERGNWFSRLQAGFRKGRGVEDQILRITQRISDGIISTGSRGRYLFCWTYPKPTIQYGANVFFNHYWTREYQISSSYS